MQKSDAPKPSFLKGCLIALAILLALAVILVWYIYKGIGNFWNDTVQEYSAEMVVQEEKLVKQADSEFQRISMDQLIQATKKYDGKNLILTGMVASKENFSKSKIPFQMPGDLLILKPDSATPTSSTKFVACFHSDKQKSAFAKLKEDQPITLRGLLEVDEEGDLMLTPCVLEP